MELNEQDQRILASLVDPDKAEEEPKYPFNDDFLRMLLGTLLCNRFFLCQSAAIIKPTFFRNEVHQNVCRILFKYFGEYKQPPSKIFLRELIEDYLKKRYKNQDDNYRTVKLLYTAEVNLIYDYYSKGGIGNMFPTLDSPDAILDRIATFAKTQAIKSAWSKSIELIKKNPESDETWEKIDTLYKEARLVNRNFDLGLNYFETPEERYARLSTNEENLETFTLGFRSIDNALMGGGLMRGELGAFMALPGGGKTCVKGTKVLMFDGSIKNVEDIKVGDVVMGDDSTPRKVLHTHRLIDQVYEVRPVKGDSYFVNSKHVLSLKNSHRQGSLRKDRPTKRNKNPAFEHHFARMGNTNIYNISVEDWLKQSQHFKTKMKGWRTGVEWPKKKVKIDPYFLGVWLGDGMKEIPSVCNIDKEVIDSVYKIAAKRNLAVRNHEDDYHIYSEENKKKQPGRYSLSKNTLKNDLRYYNLLNNKHIPFDYKVNDRASRLQLLAGLMDTDGHKHHNGFDFVNKNKVLAMDVLFLARSLGFAAYMKRCFKKCQTGNGGYYWRIFISGDCSQIPVKIKYKKCSKRKQVKDVLLTGIKVIKHNKYDEFYGFETDGNHLYLHADFTVVHNSLCLTWASVQNILRGKKVLYISTEMDQDRIGTRFDAMISNIGQHELMLKKQEVWQALRDTTNDYEDKRRLIIKQFPSGLADMAMIRAYHAQLLMLGFRPDLVIIDYPGDMKEQMGISGWEARCRLLREIRGFGVEEKHCSLVAVHPNRSATELSLDEFMDESNQGDAFKQNQIFDLFVTLNQTSAETKAAVGRGFIAKTRNGKSRFDFKIKYHFKDQTLRLEEISHHTYMGEMTRTQDEDTERTETVIDKISVGAKKFEPSDGERVE
jgi:replicative DNA helicase